MDATYMTCILADPALATNLEYEIGLFKEFG